MARRRVKLLAAATFAGALAVTGYFLAEVVREEVAIHRLGSAVESERVAATEFLAARRCVRAIPALLQLAAASEHGYDQWDPEPRYIFAALDRIVTPRALPQLLEALRSTHEDTRRWAAVTLERLDVQTDEVLAALEGALRRGEEGNVSYEVARALLRFGQRAVPILWRAYEHSGELGDELRALGPNAKEAVTHCVKQLGPTMELFDSDALWLLWAIDADAFLLLTESLPAMDEESIFVIPGQFELYGEDLQRQQLSRRLVVSRLEGFLRHERYKVRAAAAISLRALGEPLSDAARSVVQEMIHDEEEPRREDAAEILARAEETREGEDKTDGERPTEPHRGLETLPALLAKARSTDYWVHLQAHAGLEDLRLEARAFPILEELLRDPDLEVRAWAAHALGKLGAAAGPAARALRATLDDFALSVRIQGALALLAMGREKADAAAVVMDDLYFSPAPNLLKNEAMRSLATAAAQDAEILSLVLSRGEASPRLDVLRALEGAGPLAPAVVPLLAALLKSDDRDLRDVAAAALAAAGASARGATPEAIAAWKTGDARLGRAATEVLAAIDPGVAALPTFLEALESPFQTVSLAAAEGLAGLGLAAAPAVPALIGRLRRNKLAHAASYALVQMGPPAASPLAEALAGAGPDLRSWIAYTLGGMGGAPGVAVPALERLLGDQNDVTRMNAAEALGRLGSLARAAVPALEAARGDPNPEVRRHAGSALFKISCGLPGPELAPGHRWIVRETVGCAEGIRSGHPYEPPALHRQVFCSRWRKD